MITWASKKKSTPINKRSPTRLLKRRSQFQIHNNPFTTSIKWILMIKKATFNRAQEEINLIAISILHSHILESEAGRKVANLRKEVKEEDVQEPAL